jgi:hypothetical protein
VTQTEKITDSLDRANENTLMTLDFSPSEPYANHSSGGGEEGINETTLACLPACLRS